MTPSVILGPSDSVPVERLADAYQGWTVELDLTDGALVRGRFRELIPEGVRLADDLGPRRVPLRLVSDCRVEQGAFRSRFGRFGRGDR